MSSSSLGVDSATLHLQDAGSSGEGAVTGEYRFTVPWPPVEQAAFEVLRAKWSQDIPAVMRDVDFAIEPRRFGPCGGSCFLVGVGVTVEKMEGRGRPLPSDLPTQRGEADLVVEAASRRFVLRNVRIEPRCRGVVGWVVDFIGPLLTQTYSDVTLFQMPEEPPLHDRVGRQRRRLALHRGQGRLGVDGARRAVETASPVLTGAAAPGDDPAVDRHPLPERFRASVPSRTGRSPIMFAVALNYLLSLVLVLVVFGLAWGAARLSTSKGRSLSGDSSGPFMFLAAAAQSCSWQASAKWA